MGHPRTSNTTLGPDATWITGVCLPVDGGHHLRRAPSFDGYVRAKHGTDRLMR